MFASAAIFLNSSLKSDADNCLYLYRIDRRQSKRNGAHSAAGSAHRDKWEWGREQPDDDEFSYISSRARKTGSAVLNGVASGKEHNVCPSNQE